MKSLKSWSHEKFGAVSKELAQIRKNIQELSEGDHAAHQTELSQLRNHLDELLYRRR
jgi:regulator of replication initiation timing